MTRETKIGLLVGLAFIIVIGILLSDHLTATNEPAQAALVQAGPAVRQAVATPGGAVATAAPVTPTSQVAPQTPVPTREELAPHQPPVTVVQVGPAPASANGNATQPARARESTPLPANEQVAANQSNNNTANNPTPLQAQVNSTLEQVARTLNEPVVPVGAAAQPTTTGHAPSVLTVSNSTQRQYKAEPGDSLSRIAAKFFGSSTKASRDLILKANPTLQQDPNKVIVGRTYIIPPSDSQPTAQAPAPQSAPTATPEHIYTVKAGDTLTKIAVEQLGTADALPSILELNKDALKNKDVIYADMKLRLPAKPLAMAR